MYIEILKSYIKNNNNDVKKCLCDFIKNSHILDNYYHQSFNKLYLNDNIIIISKYTLNIEANGIIVNINNKQNKICISKRGNKSCIYINPEHYYIFIKSTTNKNNDRLFYENLLKII